MTRKIAMVGAVFWLVALLGGTLWGRIERQLEIRRIPPGEREVDRLQDLYGAHLFEETIKECDHARRDPQDGGILPQILYINWEATRQLNNPTETERSRQELLARFPDDPLVADTYFIDAMQSLADGQYAAAEKQLATIEQRFPKAPVTSKAREIRQRLAKAMPATTQPSASAVHASQSGGVP